MNNKEKSTDFINIGAYRAEQAEVLKKELEKNGIPVKVIYPGTSLGREATAEAYFPSYQLMVRICDIKEVKKLEKKFEIKPIKVKQKMALPKLYTWAKKIRKKICNFLA